MIPSFRFGTAYVGLTGVSSSGAGDWPRSTRRFAPRMAAYTAAIAQIAIGLNWPNS
jgi:hypothetical protein